MATDAVAPNKDFFVSYTHADQSWAEWIAWHLEEVGYSVVLQAWDFGSGTNFMEQMHRALREAQGFVGVLSPDYLAAPYPTEEWTNFLAAYAKGAKSGPFLLVRVVPCHPDGVLWARVYVDLVGLPAEAAKQRLVEAAKGQRRKPPREPAFPASSAPIFPGSVLPPAWNVPFARNPNFTGRRRLLSTLQRALTSGKPTALVQALSGLGGVGKTQLAVEYAYASANDYQIVWYVRAEEEATLVADLASLGQWLGIAEAEASDQTVILDAVREWLERHLGWLLILDNAENPGSVAPYLPRGSAGHVIITSRNPAWRTVAQVLTVGEFPLLDSVRFLVRRSGVHDRDGARPVAEELDGLPVALEQAAAYIEGTGRSFASYLELFRAERERLLSLAPPSADYPLSVAATWQLSFDRVQTRSQAGADLLHLCAFFAPDDLPRELLVCDPDLLPAELSIAARDPLLFDEAVAAVRRYSLIDVEQDILSMHRIVQAVVRDRLEFSALNEFATSAVRLVHVSFPEDSDETRRWPLCVRLLPHALSVVGHAELLDVAPDQTFALMNRVGVYLWKRGQLQQARALVVRALAIAERAHGPDDVAISELANNLGTILRDLGELAEARTLYERAFRIDGLVRDPDDPEIGVRLNNLGNLARTEGDYKAARTYYEQALAHGERIFGTEQTEIGRRLSNLGNVLRTLRDIAGARSCFQRALAIAERIDGPEHPNVAIRLSNLAGLAREEEDLTTAQNLYERALAIDEAALGPEHPEVAKDLRALGSVSRDKGDLQRAQALLERALDLTEQAHGPNHPEVAITLNALAGVLRQRGNAGHAVELAIRALDIDERAFGISHPRIGIRVTTLAHILEDLGETDEARTAYERALKIAEDVYGLSHPEVAISLLNLGTALEANGETTQAGDAYRRALEIFEAEHGPNHGRTQAARGRLSKLNQQVDANPEIK